MGRSRSRSPKRRRSRSRSRERWPRSRSPNGGGRVSDPEAAAASFAASMQQQQMAAMQQQQLQKQLLAQQLIMQVPGLQAPGQQALSAQPLLPGGITQEQATIDRKQREIYIGNLAIGIISRELLKEFFDQCFAHMVPDPAANPPVVNVNMDTTGRFAFVEFRNRMMATKALDMDKVVELCGRSMNIGRPKGYMEPTADQPELGPVALAPPPEAQAAPAAPLPAAHVGGVETTCLLLSNVLPVAELRTEGQRRILQEEVYDEAAKHGGVAGVVVPTPTPIVQELMPGRCYIKYATVDDCAQGLKVFDTRTLDENVIKASFVSDEEYRRASGGEWVTKQNGVAGIPLPGLYSIGPVASGITGLSALNPSLASLVSTNPGIAAMLTASINEDEVPYEEGYIKLRGFPPTVTKADIVEFIKGCSPTLCEDDIKLVLSADGTPLGEAFVHLHGPRAKLRLALARDRAMMPTAMCPAEVITANVDDLQRRMMSGCMLV